MHKVYFSWGTAALHINAVRLNDGTYQTYLVVSYAKIIINVQGEGAHEDTAQSWWFTYRPQSVCWNRQLLKQQAFVTSYRLVCDDRWSTLVFQRILSEKMIWSQVEQEDNGWLRFIYTRKWTWVTCQMTAKYKVMFVKSQVTGETKMPFLNNKQKYYIESEKQHCWKCEYWPCWNMIFWNTTRFCSFLTWTTTLCLLMTQF